MRPIPIAREHRDRFPGHAKTAVLGSPFGGDKGGNLTDPEVAPVEVIRYYSAIHDQAIPTVGVLLRPDAGDVEAIRNGAPLLLAFMGGWGLPIFACEVLGPLVEAEVDPETGDVIGGEASPRAQDDGPEASPGLEVDG